MPLVKYTDMLPSQQHCVRDIYSDWKPGQHADFSFWVRKDGQLATRKSGRHRMTDEAAKRMLEEYGNDIRTNGDLREWKPGHQFSFVRD